jgi:hypothetical protein
VDLDYEPAGGEERYRSVGPTDAGRLLSVVWTIARHHCLSAWRFRKEGIFGEASMKKGPTNKPIGMRIKRVIPAFALEGGRGGMVVWQS